MVCEAPMTFGESCCRIAVLASMKLTQFARYRGRPEDVENAGSGRVAP